MNNYLCLDLLNDIKARSKPESWHKSKQRIKKDFDKKNHMVENGIKIYGVNTLIGHEDHIIIKENSIDGLNEKLFTSHSIGARPYYNDFEALCVGYAKAHLYSLGGSAISPELYDLLIDAVIEPSFKPKIPKYASYSCGDVIPASHWAIALLEHIKHLQRVEYKLKTKEGLSLINGSFVQIGVALSKITNLISSFNAFSYSSTLSLDLCNVNRSGISTHLTINKDDSLLEVIKSISSYFDSVKPPQAGTQDPISLRAIPQVLSAFSDVYQNYLKTIDLLLYRRSDNPLILHELEEPLSQASFFCPQLTLMTSQLIETIMLAMWMVERRIHYLLSGKVTHIPINGKLAEEDLGLIQIPKLSTAILERIRLGLGRRNFASGSSTSYGVEDLWDCSLILLNQLEQVIEEFNKILSIELYIISYCLENFIDTRINLIEDLSVIKGSFSEKIEAIQSLIINNRIRF